MAPFCESTSLIHRQLKSNYVWTSEPQTGDRKPRLEVPGKLRSKTLYWPETRLLSATLTYTFNKLAIYHLTSNAHLWWKGDILNSENPHGFQTPLKIIPHPSAPVKQVGL